MNKPKTDIFYGLAEDIDRLARTDEIPNLLRNLVQRYDLKTIAYLGANIPGLTDLEPYLAVTYSPGWVAHYKTRGYVAIDPVIREGINRLLPLDWNTFDRSTRQIRNFFGEAVEFGLGRNGLSFPVRGMQGERALVTITSDVNDHEWRNIRRFYMRDFQALSSHVHQMILRSGGVEASQIHLSKREAECLWWSHQGKKVPEIAIILDLSRFTVRAYLEDARMKLNATSNSHAAAKANQLGLLLPGL